MAEIPDSVREVIEAGKLAHLVTLNKDGSPQVSIVWLGIEDGELVCAHLGDYQKLRNIRRDARVSVSIEADGKNSFGLDKYVVISGKARITEGGAADLLTRLAQTYIGPNAGRFPSIDNPPPGFVTHILPERFGGVGPWAGNP